MNTVKNQRNAMHFAVLWTISLLYVKFLPMANDVFYCLPFAKVKEIEKTFRDNWICDADILSFCDHLESNMKQKNMWEQLKSGKSHTSRVSYALTLLLNQLCSFISS